MSDYKSDNERIVRNVESEDSKIYAGKKLAPFFEVDLTLKMFGQVIFIWHFPPKK